MKNGFPVFATIIEANHISKKQDEFASSRLTEDDIRAIRDISKDPRIRQRVRKSIFNRN
jgi:DNA replication licensing factor MCM2